jgi:UDP-N-acetylmuramoylalanine--D-glutamate ligase
MASPHTCVCLMVAPEHLDWHLDNGSYLAAKTRLFEHQSANDKAIYFADNELSKKIADASPGEHLPYFAPPGAYVDQGSISVDGISICKTDELKLLGKHNWQNVCAALTVVWQVTREVETIRSVLTDFTGLEHRLEFVREFEGLRFYNDSFATNLSATEAAIESIEGKKVIIIGGFDRNLDISHFGSFVKKNGEAIRTLLVIGASGERVVNMLVEAGFTNFVLDKEAKTMAAIVNRARSLTQSGDAVVLSPGFASFDMFKNFEDRGLQFKEVVNSL